MMVYYVPRFKRKGSLNGAESYMMDASQLTRHMLKPEELWSVIFDGKGCSSVYLLRRVVGELHSLSNPYMRQKGEGSIMDEVLRHMEDFGPALISGFTVTESFTRDRDQYQYSGHITDMRDEDEKHAMVLVGARVDNDGKSWFRIQNWWPSKQFLEVDYQRLVDSGASLNFVLKAVPQEPPFGTAMDDDILVIEASSCLVMSDCCAGEDTGDIDDESMNTFEC
jgi:hypothetical protein